MGEAGYGLPLPYSKGQNNSYGGNSISATKTALYEITTAKMVDGTLIEKSDLRIRVYGEATREGDPMFDSYFGDGNARISKVIFAEDFHMLAGDWFSSRAQDHSRRRNLLTKNKSEVIRNENRLWREMDD